MGEVPSASGESDENGNCSVTGEDGVVGVVPGVYRVEITHPSEKIKAKYNDSSQLRVAVDPSNPYAQTPEYRVD